MAARGRAKATALVGVAAAGFLAVALNVAGARHYRRWDWTADRKHSLSEASRATLRGLSEPVEVWVLLGQAEPLRESLRQILVAYQAETRALDVRWVDPDKDALTFAEIERRFRVERGRTADGRVVSDAVAVVARGDRHWFVTASDLVEIASVAEAKVRPREEQALTHAIRQVTSGEKARICFSTGHGEPPAEALRAILEKDNYATTTVDPTAPDAVEPWKGCAVAALGGPRAPFGADEANRLRTYLLEGGRLFAALGPVPAADGAGFGDAGLGPALVALGISLDADVVVEVDPSRALPEGHGASFFAEAREHPVTLGLVRRPGAPDPPRILLEFARSMRVLAPPGVPPPVPLLATSGDAFGLVTIAGAGGFRDAPTRGPRDLGGPLVLAMAGERPVGDGRHARAVVVGSAKVLDDRGFRDDPAAVRGAAYVVENAISWLAARPAILDVPAKDAVPAGLRISEASREEVRRYVLVYMPLAAALVALAIALRRRSTEGK